MKTLLIRNAQIATSTQVFQGDLLVEGEKIKQVGGSIVAEPSTETIDAQGRFLLPGGVDPHTHFDLDVGFTRTADDFYTGSVAAACGGTTTVIDHMAFGPKGCRLTHQQQVYQKLAERAVIDYGLHGVIQHVNDEVIDDMQTLIDTGITSAKIYLTYDFMLHNEDVLRVLRRAKELGMVVCVHCENHAIVTALRERLVREGKTAVRYHPLSRPPEAEAEAVFRILMLAKIAGEAKLYVVHLTSALGLNTIQLARATGQSGIYAETCPQYLLLDDSKYNDPVEGLKYTMSPPLRKKEDQDALWKGLANGDIQTVGTDHCSFSFGTQKQRGAQDFTQCPNGAPGVELRIPQLFSEGYQKGRLTLPQVVQTCCTRPAEIFGIGNTKGDIREGMDADLVLIDPNQTWQVKKSLLHEHVDYTPYEDMTLNCRPVLTISRGEIIVKDGEFLAAESRGRYLHRALGE